MDVNIVFNKINDDLQKNFNFALKLENERLERLKKITGFSFGSKNNYILDYKKYLSEVYVQELNKIDVLVRDFIMKEERLVSIVAKKDENVAKELSSLFPILKSLIRFIDEFRNILEKEYELINVKDFSSYLKEENLLKDKIYALMNSLNKRENISVNKFSFSKKSIVSGIFVVLFAANSLFMTSNSFAKNLGNHNNLNPETVVESSLDNESVNHALSFESKKEAFLKNIDVKIGKKMSFIVDNSNPYFDDIVKKYFPGINVSDVKKIFFNSKITAYTPFGPGLMKGDAKGAGLGQTASQKKVSLKKGAKHDGIAIPKNVLDYGTKVYIPGVGIKVADDTGGALNKLWKKKGVFQADVRMGDYDEAIEFGKKRLHIVVFS